MEKEARAQLCKFVHRAYDQNLVTSSSGSFSARLNNGKDDKGVSFIVTPTCVDRRSLEPSDLCYISNCNPKSSNDGKEPQSKVPRLSKSRFWFHPTVKDEVTPSRAAAIHATIFEEHPSINYVMVVQPPYATSYCITGIPFNSAGIPESHIILHKVQTLPLYSVLCDDGAALAKALEPSTGKNTVLVEGYGLVTVGQDLLKTFVQVEVCESMCGVSLIALRRGPVTLLSKDQVNDIDKAFKMAH
jgi:L-fuculose-phosphate aldolase